MVVHNGHCLDKVQTGTFAEGYMHYDHEGNENNSNKSAGDTLGSTNNQNGVMVEYAALMADTAYQGQIQETWKWDIIGFEQKQIKWTVSSV